MNQYGQDSMCRDASRARPTKTAEVREFETGSTRKSIPCDAIRIWVWLVGIRFILFCPSAITLLPSRWGPGKGKTVINP